METSRPRKPFFNAFREEVANGFLAAGTLGSAYHFAKGGFQAVCKNVPRISCSAAVFFGAYEAIDYAMVSARRKEEPVLDSAVAAAGASGITALPKGGLRWAGQSALMGAAIGGVVIGGLRLLLEDPSPPVVKQADEVPGTPVVDDEIR